MWYQRFRIPPTIIDLNTSRAVFGTHLGMSAEGQAAAVVLRRVLRECPYLWLFSRIVPLSIVFTLQDNNLGVIDEPVGGRRSRLPQWCCRRYCPSGAILQTFGLNPDNGHIINGHVPVMVKKNESPLKAGGKLIVIDGGFPRAYQKKTGIAGYTLVYNSWGLLLSTHQQSEASGSAVRDMHDIDCTTEIIESRHRRIRIKDTDLGREIRRRIEELTLLHDAYQKGEMMGMDLKLWH